MLDILSKELLFKGKVYVTLTIVTTPSSAACTINGETTKTLTVELGTEIFWSVTASNYYSKSGSLVLLEDIILEVALEAWPYTKNQVLLTVAPSGTSATSGSITLKATGSYKLELEAGGGAGAGWMDSYVGCGGGSGAAIVVNLKLSEGTYKYSVSGKTSGSGFWSCGGSGGSSYFRNSNSSINFTVTGGEGKQLVSSVSGGTVSSFTSSVVTSTILRKNGNGSSGWTDVPGGHINGGASVYPVNGVNYGAGGHSTQAGMQGYLRLTFLTI